MRRPILFLERKITCKWWFAGKYCQDVRLTEFTFISKQQKSLNRARIKWRERKALLVTNVVVANWTVVLTLQTD